MAIPAIHPGEHLAEELKELGLGAAELARQLGVPTNRVTEILNGRRAKGRKIHQPPADPEAFRGSTCIAVLAPFIWGVAVTVAVHCPTWPTFQAFPAGLLCAQDLL